MRTPCALLLTWGALTLPLAVARSASAAVEPPRVVVLISADAEWRAVRALLPDASVSPSPFEEGTRPVMKRLLDDLPFWLTRWDVPSAKPSP